MASINATTSSGIVATADNTGTLQLQSAGTTIANVTSTGLTVTGTGSFSGNLSFNSGYGSAAVAYGCRAWVNFNGTGTPAIRASGNVSSLTDNGDGDVSVNFTVAMPDTNYCVGTGASYRDGSGRVSVMNIWSYSTTSIRIRSQEYNDTSDFWYAWDLDQANISIFR